MRKRVNKTNTGLIALCLILGAFSYVVYRTFRSLDIDLLDGWSDEEEEDYND